MAKPRYSSTLDDFKKKLALHYKITNLKDRNHQTFCGVTVYQNREDGDLWLSQKVFLNTIFYKYTAPKPWSKCPPTPLPSEALVSSTGNKNPYNAERYAQIVGSIRYAASATRPDVSKAHSKLAEFLTNPSNHHLTTAY